MSKVLANLLIFLGFVIISIFVFHFYQRNYLGRLKIDISTMETTTIQDSKPVAIYIKELGISLPVIITAFDGKKWNTTNEGVSYIGNNIYYGHNWGSILGNLYNAKVGQEIEITNSDGFEQKFVIREIKVVEPNNGDVLKLANENTLILYTCIGFLDSKRLIIIAKKS